LNKAFKLGPTAIVTLVLMKIEFQAKEGVLFNYYNMCCSRGQATHTGEVKWRRFVQFDMGVGSEKYLCCKMIGSVGG